MKIALTVSAILLAGWALGGCALLAAGVVGAVVAEDVQPEYYEPPPIFYGPVWRPQPYFRPPVHRRLKLAVACPIQCGPKWMNPIYPMQNPHGDFAWQVCVSVYNGNPQTCVPPSQLKGFRKWK